MRPKRIAQASIEFLMTYGWAIIIILVVVVVAWQWGLFDISGSVRPGYSGFWGVVPEDFSYRENGDLVLSLSNNIGANINITSTEITIGTGNYLNNNQIQIPSGDKTTLTTAGLPGSSRGSNYEVFLSINYTDERTGLETYRSSGRIWGSVEG